MSRRGSDDPLLGIRERRAAELFEVRAGGSDKDNVTLTGYASTFDPYPVYGGPKRGGWIEKIDRYAFDKTLRAKPDLHLLINHAGMPLARTKSGTLKLSVDDHGLKVEACLDLRDPEVQSLDSKMRRGDMDEMSFAFRVKAQKWSAAPGFDDPQSFRVIEEIDLSRGDVSVVNWGANAQTSAEVLRQSKKKATPGVRRRLTLAEAASIVLVDENWKRKHSGSKVLSLAEAEELSKGIRARGPRP